MATQTQGALALDTAVSSFDFHAHPVRVVLREAEPWFVAADVCSALGYLNPSKAVADHLDADEKSNQSLGLAGKPVIIISESGLYALVLRSRKPEARKFAKWVTSEVLPAIRKTGSYSVKPQPESVSYTEARQSAHQFVNACRAAVTAAGAQMPAWPALTEAVVDGILADVLMGKRFIVSFDDNLQMHFTRVPSDACVGSLSDLARMIADPNGMMPSNRDLAALAQACSHRLAERMSRQAA